MASWNPLYGEICELLEEFVIPKNVLPVFQRDNILTKKDIGAIKRKSDCEGARRLLDILVQKKGDWFTKLHTVLCDSNVKLCHIADIMMHEKNRFVEQQSASCQRSSRPTRVENSGPASTLSALYKKYNKNLENVIRKYVSMIDDPVTLLRVLLKYSDKVLTKIDCDNVKAEVQNNGSHEGADLLFSRLILYDSWLDILLKALKHEDIRLPQLAEEIELRTSKITEEYERNLSQIQHLYNMNNNVQLEDNRMATDDPSSILRINGSRDNRSPDNVRDEYESDCAEMKPSVKQQARGRKHKENTFSDGVGQNHASQEGSSENGHVTNGKTQLMRAAASGDLDLILNLLDGGASIDESDRNGRTALMYAVLKHRFECLQLFISKGCDVNKRDNSGCTALMISADKNFTDCLSLLIQAKSNVDNADDKDFTALMVAAMKGFVDCMRLLIKNHCDVDKCRKNGWTALMYAALRGHSECVDLLIQSGCDVNKVDNNLGNALIHAASGGHLECADLLIRGGANVDSANNTGYTAVIYAAWRGHSECVDLLIRSGCDVNKVDNSRYTALMHAVYDSHLVCANLLIKGGADVDLADEKGDTAVMFAALRGHSECVDLLIHSHCDVNKVNNKRVTALMSAFKGDHTECVNLLINGGAM